MSEPVPKQPKTEEEVKMLHILREAICEIDSVTVVDELEFPWENKARRILKSYGMHK